MFHIFMKEQHFISINNINRLIFVTEIYDVFCDVRTEYLNITYINFMLPSVKNSFMKYVAYASCSDQISKML